MPVAVSTDAEILAFTEEHIKSLPPDEMKLLIARLEALATAAELDRKAKAPR